MTVIGIERSGNGSTPAALPSASGQAWVRRLGWFAAVCALAAGALGLLGLVDIIDGLAARPAALLLIAFSGLAGAAAVAAQRTQSTLLGRLDLFGQALEASP